MPNTAPFTHLAEVVTDAIALAIVIFAISISMGKLLAKKHDYEVDANQVSVKGDKSESLDCFEMID